MTAWVPFKNRESCSIVVSSSSFIIVFIMGWWWTIFNQYPRFQAHSMLETPSTFRLIPYWTRLVQPRLR